MTQVNRATLKSYFNTGDVPTEAQFADLIDSLVSILDDLPLEYVALVSQAGVGNPPTATVIKNTTGATVSFTYNGVGSYSAVFSLPVLTAGKAISILEAVIAARQYASSIVDPQTVHINTASSTGAAADGVLGDSPFIVRVYP